MSSVVPTLVKLIAFLTRVVTNYSLMKTNSKLCEYSNNRSQVGHKWMDQTKMNFGKMAKVTKRAIENSKSKLLMSVVGKEKRFHQIIRNQEKIRSNLKYLKSLKIYLRPKQTNYLLMTKSRGDQVVFMKMKLTINLHLSKVKITQSNATSRTAWSLKFLRW